MDVRHSTNQTPIVPAARTRYLAEIGDTVRGYKKRAREQARLAREVQQLQEAARMLQAWTSPTARPAAEAALDLAGKRRGAAMDNDARTCSRSGPTCSRPTRATSTW